MPKYGTVSQVLLQLVVACNVNQRLGAFCSEPLRIQHSRRPSGGGGGHSGREKKRDEKLRRKSPWVPTLSGSFPNGQANASSWLGTKNALHYCAQSANSISWVLFVSSYTTAIDSITACLAHASKKCTQSGNFQFHINSPFQNAVYPKTKRRFSKNTSLSLQQVFTLASVTRLA